MEDIILQIVAALRRGEEVGERELVKLIHAQAKRAGGDKRAFAKRRLLPFYQRVKHEDPERWARWGITPELEERLVATLRIKPRRSASGVATITVITKPWPCSGSCIFCPNDIRMPKSYLADEPACARAEQNYFDPYLQVSARLTALAQMGHATDKIELIVLGGTWSDYPAEYQTWFVTELFRALNDDAVAGVTANPMLRGFPAEGTASMAGAEPTEGAALEDGPASAAAPVDPIPAGVRARRERYRACGIERWYAEEGAAQVDALQPLVDAGEQTYNQAIGRLFRAAPAWRDAAAWQRATMDDLEHEQRRNESARHRVVGLVVETRPDAITPAALALIRRMGATKIQMGVQSVNQKILKANGRGITTARIARSFDLLRLFGFKIHAHFMANLLGATPEADKRDYRSFVTGRAYLPDEVKLYPCALIGSSRLRERYEAGEWVPYTEDELVGVLAADVLATPAFCRVSRMIRDFSSLDIMAGNKKPNLRQLVERRVAETGEPVHEIRYREIALDAVDPAELELKVVPYETTATSECFLQWVTPAGRIAGFLRLSLPREDAVRALGDAIAAGGTSGPGPTAPGETSDPVPTSPIAPGEAMIREVHVYGSAVPVGEEGHAAQHQGLGRRLVERACELARAAGYARINVISAVGTREYYRRLGFHDHGLYQQREL
ncbi:elongator complex protein 3 [Enorma phocaeensis]|uniref:elongator complex protein 3 n=1 Tax=Enorma phocaeensis TaxID=1871019 RepID=UPI002357B4A1|nr:GNAT family N-acetyltransferase [Enorma phocaeensis]